MQLQRLTIGMILRAYGLSAICGKAVTAVGAGLYGKAFATALERMGAGLEEKSAISSEDRTGALYSVSAAVTTFAANVFAATILGRLAARSAPFATPLPLLTTSTVAGFVGEGVVIPATAAAFVVDQLDRAKIAAILVTTLQLLEQGVNVEQVLETDLRAALVAAGDAKAFDVTAASADVRPAGLLHGVSALDADGAATVADVDGVIADLQAQMAGAKGDLLGSVFVSHTDVALALAGLRGSGGVQSHPGVTVAGGTLAGLRYITSQSAPAQKLVLVDPQQLLVASDPIEVSASTHALIDQNSSPAGATRVSMFQEDSVALKALLRMSWTMARPCIAAAENLDLPRPTWSGSPQS